MASRGCQSFGQFAQTSIKLRPFVPFRTSISPAKPLNMATIATYKVPKVENENNVGRQEQQSMHHIRLMQFLFQKHYAKGSPDRKALEAALHEAGQKTLEVPTVIDGKEVSILNNYTRSGGAIAPKFFCTRQWVRIF